MSETAAMEAMRARGIGNAGELMSFATPEVILATCRWWDRQKGVGAGLLAKKIREGGIPEEEKPDPLSVVDLKQREQNKRFAVHAQRWPEGSVIETHAALAQRAGWDDECAGRMVVYDVTFPNLGTECDRCRVPVGYSLQTLDSLPARRPALRRVAA